MTYNINDNATTSVNKLDNLMKEVKEVFMKDGNIELLELWAESKEVEVSDYIKRWGENHLRDPICFCSMTSSISLHCNLSES